MAIVKPYIIRQVRLDNFDAESKSLPVTGSCYYHTYWWKNICLGQAFYSGEKLSNLEFRTRIINSVAPAIAYYSQKRNIAVQSYNDAFVNGDYRVFYDELSLVFGNDQTTVATGQSLNTNLSQSQLIPLPAISVIICTRNRPLALEQCLKSIFKQEYKATEVIVVDNAPTGDDTRLLVDRYPGVRYILEPRGGLSIARNAGLRAATSPVVAFTDDDVSVHPSWLYQVSESFLNPSVGAMTGLVIPSELETPSQQLFEKEWSFNNGYTDKIFGTDYFQNQLATGPRVWEIGAGANMAFRSSVFSQTGVFDERLGAGAAGCSEDSEMWFRILNQGLEIHYNPRAVVFHEHRKELKELHKQIFSYMRGHAAAALIQEGYENDAHYRRYLFRKVAKGYIPLILKKMLRKREESKLLFIQLRGLISGVLFFIMHRNKPSQTNY